MIPPPSISTLLFVKFEFVIEFAQVDLHLILSDPPFSPLFESKVEFEIVTYEFTLSIAPPY